MIATIITITTRAVRSGTITTAARNIPAGMVGNIWLRFDIAEPDLSDPAKSATLRIQRRLNASSAYADWAAMSWQGGPETKPGANRQPSIGGPAEELAGQQARMIAVLTQSITTGLIIELP